MLCTGRKCGHTGHSAPWRSENKLVGSVLFFHLPSGFGNRTQVTMFVPQVPLPAGPSHRSIFSCACWSSVDLLENICQMLNPLLIGLSLSCYSLRDLYLIYFIFFFLESILSSEACLRTSPILQAMSPLGKLPSLQRKAY